MAIKTWLGGSSGVENDFATAANWSPSGVPAAGDTLIFSTRANKDANGVHYRCVLDSGDGWDQSAKNFAAIYGYAGFTGGVGSGGSGTFNGLACGCDKIRWMADSDAYLIAKNASGKFDDVVMESAGYTLYIARAGTSGTATDTARCYAGTIHFFAPVTGQTDILNPDVDTLLEANGVGASIIVGIRADLASNEVATIKTFNGGLIYIDHPWTAAYAHGGTIYYGETDDSQVPTSEQAAGTLYLYGGNCEWYMYSKIKGVQAYAGSLIAKGELPKTLGDSSVNSGTMPIYGGTIDLSQSGGPVTLGADCEIQVLSDAASFIPQFDSQIVFTKL